MKIRTRRSGSHQLDRRGFMEFGARAAAALIALPAVAWANLSCGSGDEDREATPSPRTSPPPAPSEATPAPTTKAPASDTPAPPPEAPGDNEGQLVTEVAAVATIVRTLQYVNDSKKPGQRCATCQLYTAQSGGRGKCLLFAQGLVKETGWCASWVQRSS